MPKTLLPLSLSLYLLATASATAAPPKTKAGAKTAQKPAAKAAPADTTFSSLFPVTMGTTGATGSATARRAAPDPGQGNALFQQAIAQTKAGKTAQAEATYHKLLQLFPNAAPAWANLGLLAVQGNRLDEAAADLRKAVALEPKTAPFWAQLSSVELRRGRAKEAEAAARRTLELDGGNLFALGDLAGALMQQGRNAEAAVPLRKLLLIEGEKNPQATFSLAVALARSGQRAEALALAKKLAARYPERSNYQLMLGDLAAQSGDYAAARRAYTRVYTLVPSDTRAALNAAIAAEMQGDVPGAKAQVEKLVAAHPGDALAQFNLGRLRYLSSRKPDDFLQAAASFNKAVLLAPKNPLYLTNNALALMFAGPDHFTEATKYYLSALNVDPRQTTAHMGLAYLYEQQRQPSDAIAQYRAVLAYAPEQYDARRRLAGLLYATGKKDDAYQEFWTLAEKTPGEKGAVPLKELASLLVNDKRPEEARKAYEQAAARDPKDAEALVGLGQALESLKEPAAAQAKYEAALAASPTNASAYVALGNLLHSQNKIAEETTVYERFVAADPANNLARWQLAQLYRDQKRDDDALREMHQLTIRRDDPLRVDYLLGPARLLALRGRYADALQEIEPLVAQNPSDSVELRYALADVQEKAGKTDDAEKTLLQLASEAKQRDAQIRIDVRLGQFYEDRNRPEEAAHHYEDTLSMAPDSPTARIGLWRVRSKQGKPDAATEYLESLALAGQEGPDMTAVSSVQYLYQQERTPEKYVAFTKRVADHYPKSRVALNLYAQTLLQTASGSPKEKEAHTQAAELFRQMTALDPKDADAFYQLGSQEEQIGSKEAATAAYRSAIRAAVGGATASGGADASAAAAENARAALKRLGISETAATVAPTAPAPPAAKAPAEGNGTLKGVPNGGS